MSKITLPFVQRHKVIDDGSAVQVIRNIPDEGYFLTCDQAEKILKALEGYGTVEEYNVAKRIDEAIAIMTGGRNE